VIKKKNRLAYSYARYREVKDLLSLLIITRDYEII
jgi:hypothetical protein